MFSKIAFALSTLTVLAAAIPTPGGYSVSQCNTSGYTACCNSATNVNDLATELSALLTLNVGSLTGLVGLGCSPLIPVGGSVDCSQKPVCCENNTQNGLVNVQCVDLAL